MGDKKKKKGLTSKGEHSYSEASFRLKMEFCAQMNFWSCPRKAKEILVCSARRNLRTHTFIPRARKEAITISRAGKKTAKPSYKPYDGNSHHPGHRNSLHQTRKSIPTGKSENKCNVRIVACKRIETKANLAGRCQPVPAISWLAGTTACKIPFILQTRTLSDHLYWRQSYWGMLNWKLPEIANRNILLII